jgi:anti-sigma B factor antagonist
MPPASYWSNQLLCRREDLDGAVCLVLTGELDLASIATLQAHLKAVADIDDNVIVEMSGLRYIDSSGAKALLDAHRTFTRRGLRFGLAAPSAMTRRIFEVLGLETVLPMFETVDAALQQLRGGRKPREER